MGKVLQFPPQIKACPKCDCGYLDGRVVHMRDYFEGETFAICYDCMQLLLEAGNGRLVSSEEE